MRSGNGGATVVWQKIIHSGSLDRATAEKDTGRFASELDSIEACQIPSLVTGKDHSNCRRSGDLPYISCSSMGSTVSSSSELSDSEDEEGVNGSGA